MQTKILKWSKRLKYLFLFLLIINLYGLVVSLPDILTPTFWSETTIHTEILKEATTLLGQEITPIHPTSDAIAAYSSAKHFWVMGELAAIAFNVLFLFLGYQLLYKLSQTATFDDYTSKKMRLIGILLTISGIVVPSLGQIDVYPQVTLLGGFGFDIIIDFYRVSFGMAILLIAHLFKHGYFLQAEYDTLL